MPASPPFGFPDAEVTLDETLVRHLLRTHHPDLADHPLDFVAEGFDNLTVRCGDDLALRLPRRALGARMLEVELRWLPTIGPELPVATPIALRITEASPDYPWRWAIVPWIDGSPAAASPLAATEAARLGEFLRTLHGLPLPAEAPSNPYRGGPLGGRADATAERLARLEELGEPAGVDFGELRVHFASGLDAPDDTPVTWIHGDLHPRNAIVAGGNLAGIIDWGDMCVGHPHTDLAAAWLFFDRIHHEVIWDVYEPTTATLVRTRAWAVAFAAMLFEAGLSNDPLLEAVGRTALVRLLG